MRMDKLTSRFQQALADAQSLAVGRDHTRSEPVHVWTALLEQQGLWWRVDVLDTVSGVMDLVGWCHSRYLARG